VTINLLITIGPGLLESAYEHALANDLRELGLEVKQQIPMPLIYKAISLKLGYRIDLMVNNKVMIEVKSIEALAPVHFAQTLTYLRLSGLKFVLLIIFNSKFLKSNIHRIVNSL
jgi:GxxExxY protein